VLTSLFANIFTAAEAGINIGLHQAFGPRLDTAMDSIVHYFLDKTSATHLFFLDDDVLLPSDGILRLLKRGAPIISGLYKERGQKHRPIIIDTPKNREGKLRFLFRYAKRAPRNRLLTCDVVPSGCLLVERSVFQRLHSPWFHMEPNLGPDVYFSLCARRAGYKVLLDTGVECIHIVTHLAGSDEAIDAWKREFGFTLAE
jgi:GT2 family glycosyltransferase